LLAEAEDLDLEAKVVTATGPDCRTVRLPYDTLVVAAGATHAYFGRDEWAQVAPGMKTIEDARHLRSHILLAFEMAELSEDPAERAEWLTFVVIGAGPTGVELVGQVAELAHQVLPRDYRTVDTTEARIILLEGAGAVLGAFHPKLQNYAAAQLRRKGVEVRLNTLAVAMDSTGVTVKGPDGEERIPARTRVWAAGVQASPLAAGWPRPPARRWTGPAGSLSMRTARCPGIRRSSRSATWWRSTTFPAWLSRRCRKASTSEADRRAAARIPARQAVQVLRQGHDGHDRHNSAVAEAFGRRFTGRTGYVMWAFIHNLYLIGWGNRLGTLYTWVRAWRSPATARTASSRSSRRTRRPSGCRTSAEPRDLGVVVALMPVV
jgi:NADH dehydrogenase